MKYITRSLHVALWIVVVFILIISAFLLGMRSVGEVRDLAYKAGYNQAANDFGINTNTLPETPSTEEPVELFAITGKIFAIDASTITLETELIAFDDGTVLSKTKMAITLTSETAISALRTLSPEQLATEADLGDGDGVSIEPTRQESLLRADLRIGDQVRILTLDDPREKTTISAIRVIRTRETDIPQEEPPPLTEEERFPENMIFDPQTPTPEDQNME